MRKGTVGFFMVLCCGALLASGCAKKEMVKGEESIPPASNAPSSEKSSKPSATAIKEEAVKEQPIKEASAKEESVKAATAENMLKTIYFDFDSYVLSQTSRDILFNNADYLMKNGSLKIRVEGNCDERGSDEYNLSLGEKRAKSAMDYLVTLGVPANRISVISYGKEKPVDPGHDEAAWAKNRRDDFVLISK